MKVEYSDHALVDLHKIGSDNRRIFGAAATEALERRIREAVRQIGEHPEDRPK